MQDTVWRANTYNSQVYTCCEFIDQCPLTEDLLWEVAEGLFHEAIHLDTLDDFRATLQELTNMKDTILQTWMEEDWAWSQSSSLGITLVLGNQGNPVESSTTPLSRSPPGISFPQVLISFGVDAFPTPASSYSMWGAGSIRGYNFDPIMGQALMTTLPMRFPFMSGCRNQSISVLL